MPFTPAHPAIILPLSRSKQFSVTALIAGSMAPDFEFFFQMREVENIGHHWYGIILFDVPVALLLCYLFHNLLRNAFIAHVPDVLQKRISFATHFNWNEYAAASKTKVAISLLTGVASHLLWDGFTHHDGIFVELFPVLALKTNWQMVNVPVYYLLQLFFSVLGLAAVVFALYRLPLCEQGTNNISSKYYWPLLISATSILFVTRITVWPQYNSFGGMAIAAMGSITYGWLLISAIFHYYLLKKISL
ncbi:MAG TPA: DUF4184 family protein [Lacibacter sp.]|nr:DUF4184 family protein [Lacibacter sp.]